MSPMVVVFVTEHARTGLNYSEFAVVAAKGSFSTAQRVETVVKDLSSRWFTHSVDWFVRKSLVHTR